MWLGKFSNSFAGVLHLTRIRRIEFCDLPKTISGKTRRVQMRDLESKARQDRRPDEYWKVDFPDL